MKLPDVQALMGVGAPEWVTKDRPTTGDELSLRLGVEKGYWNPKDVGDTWIEYIGDATSMYNLLLLLPGAKAGAAGRMNTIFWGKAELEAIAAYEKSGQVISGTEFVANFRSDGLIIGSPTGSTAYALSAGGPILHPGIAGWVLVPIAPHDLSNRPIVLPDTGEIGIEIVAGRDASVSFDMQSLASLLHGDRISVRRSAHQVRFLHPRGWSYYATLRRKLHWNSGVN